MIDIKFDFDDILVCPETTTHINSRYEDIFLEDNLPLYTAPMDTVVDLNTMDKYIYLGVTVVLPRTITYVAFCNHVFKTCNISMGDVPDSKYSNVFVSFGFHELNGFKHFDYDNFHFAANILIDVANGHMHKILEYCEDIKLKRPDIKIMVGNIGNPEAYECYARSGVVDIIRCTIGNGGGCLTSKNTSIGYPTASLISEIKVIKNTLISGGYLEEYLPKFIADGGMKDYSDVIKAFALGADGVMLGSIFNKAIDSCGYNYFMGIKLNLWWSMLLYKKGYKVKKKFRGMSTKSVQRAMGKKELKTSEGVVRYRNVEYTLSGWMENFKHYLRSAMSYTDKKRLEDFIGQVKYVHITNKAFDRFNK